MVRAIASCWRAASSWPLGVSATGWGSGSGGCRPELAAAAEPRGFFGQPATLPSASMYLSRRGSRCLLHLRHS
eukprot:10781716-Lingulodinium_polyedra.AAC.1